MQPLDHTSSYFNTLLNAYAQAAHVERAEKVPTTMEKAQAAHVERAEKVPTTMKEPCLTPDIRTFSALMNVYAPAAAVERAEKVLTAKEKAQAADVAGAEKVLTRIKEARLKPDIQTYNTLLNAYAGAAVVEGAENVLTRIKEAHLRPDIQTYNTLLLAYIYGNKEEIHPIIRMMDENTVLPNTMTYQYMVDFYLKNNLLDEAKNAFSNIKSLPVINFKEGRIAVDCHDLSHATACLNVQNFIKKIVRDDQFIIITGKGIHSRKGDMYQMQEYVLDFAKKYLTDWILTIDKKNPGCLIVEKRKSAGVKDAITDALKKQAKDKTHKKQVFGNKTSSFREKNAVLKSLI